MMNVLLALAALAQPTVAFETGESLASESASPVKLTVRLSAPSDGPVEVTFTLIGGSAWKDDFRLVGAAVDARSGLMEGTLTFDPGVTTRQIAIEIVPDAIREGDETIKIRLSRAKGARMGDMREHVCTIRDDGGAKPKAGFAAAASSVSERSGATDLEVTLSAPSVKAVSLEYAVTGGTAVPGRDCKVAAGRIDLEPGITRAAIRIEILEDTEEEPDETVEITLRNPQDAELGESKHTLTIIDDNRFIDFHKSEISAFAGFTIWSSDFEADPDYALGICWRAPAPGIDDKFGVWAEIMVAHIERDLPIKVESGFALYFGLGGDYTFYDGKHWFLRGELGVLYGEFLQVTDLDDGFAAVVGFTAGWHFSERFSIHVHPRFITALYDTEGDEHDWTLFINIGIQLDF